LLSTSELIVSPDDPILITGASGFIGSKVVGALKNRGFRNLRCLVRASSDLQCLPNTASDGRIVHGVRFVEGDLLCPDACEAATRDISVIYHLAAATRTKSFADMFMNSVVTTRNLLEGALRHGCLRRFVNVSSFAVYTNGNKQWSKVLDESCPTEQHPELRGDAYCFAKVKQDELVVDYGKKHAVPYVLVRPGVVYGPGKLRIHGRVGLGTFGIFLHLGGSNLIPFTYVDNCAEAIVLAGLRNGVEGEVFNVVDDDLPTSRQFLRMYKRELDQFPSVYIPHLASYLLCFLWEKYSVWSRGQLPPVYNRRAWTAYWKPTRYSNEKIKRMLDWTPKVSTAEALKKYFASCLESRAYA
jgi:nucleoside-diphosphate-sugar epimerase